MRGTGGHWWLVLAFGCLALLSAAGEGTPAVAQAPPAMPTSYRFEDDDPFVTYGGDWETRHDSQAGGGRLHQTRSASAFVELIFDGPFVIWYGFKGPDHGLARVRLDGRLRETVDLFQPTPGYGVVRWYGGLTSDSTHHIRIEGTGSRTGAASDSLVDLDAFLVQSAPVVPAPTASAGPTATPPAGAGLVPVPAATPTPGLAVTRQPGSWPIDPKFQRYYAEHDGLRVLGNTNSPPTFFANYFVQYFEKGRIEDHSAETSDPRWQLQFGLLVDELQGGQASVPIGGEASTLRYSDLPDISAPEKRLSPPEGFAGGMHVNRDGSVFVPYTADLRPGPGHNAAAIFWPYMNRQDLFPAGWLHDIGLPMTEVMPAMVDKGTMRNRQILIQVFQRTVLTYDPLNPPDFQIERANVGSDYRKAFPDQVPQ